MKYTLDSGKIVNISDEQIQKYMKSLDLTKEEAIDLWLEDNDFQENEELEELDTKAKKVKINHGACGNDEKIKKKSEKPKTVKTSDEKKALYTNILEFLVQNAENAESPIQNVQILKENKLISVQIGEKTYKIDIIEQRAQKKS